MQVKLEDVEEYMLRQTYEMLFTALAEDLRAWLRNRFAEVRAREEAKVLVAPVIKYGPAKDEL